VPFSFPFPQFLSSTPSFLSGRFPSAAAPGSVTCMEPLPKSLRPPIPISLPLLIRKSHVLLMAPVFGAPNQFQSWDPLADHSAGTSPFGFLLDPFFFLPSRHSLCNLVLPPITSVEAGPQSELDVDPFSSLVFPDVVVTAPFLVTHLVTIPPAHPLLSLKNSILPFALPFITSFP